MSGVVLLPANILDIFPDFIKIFPIQLVLWVLLYLCVFQFATPNVVERRALPLPPPPTSIDSPINITELIETVAVRTGKKLHIIPISEIVCLQAYGDYVNIMTLQGTYLKEQTLKYFEEHLPENQFVRVHRSHIVNLHAIAAIERYGREQYLFILSNKEKVKATLEGYRRVKGALKL
jgi:DNA-binding LytR/AlgR family response regulator